MGVGSWLSRFIERQLIAQVLRSELLVALIGGLMPAGLFVAYSLLPAGEAAATTTAPTQPQCRPGLACITSPAATVFRPLAKRRLRTNARAGSRGPRATAGWCGAWPRRWGTACTGGRTVLQVTEAKHGVEVVVWNEITAAIERWSAPTVVLAVPLFVSARLLAAPPTALLTATKLLSDAPWLVANVHIDRPLLDRPGAPPSWDNVAYASGVPGSDGLNALRGQRGRLRFVHSDLCGSSVFEEAFSVGHAAALG